MKVSAWQGAWLHAQYMVIIPIMHPQGSAKPGIETVKSKVHGSDKNNNNNNNILVCISYLLLHNK